MSSKKQLPENIPQLLPGFILYGWGPVPREYEGGRQRPFGETTHDTIAGWPPYTSQTSWARCRAGVLSGYIYSVRENSAFGQAILSGALEKNYSPAHEPVPPTAHEF